MRSSCSTSAGFRTRKSSSAASPPPRWPTRSGRSRCAALRRSASPRRTGTRSRRSAGRTWTRRTESWPSRGRRPSISSGRSSRCAATRPPSGLARLHEAEVDRCKRMGAHAAVLFGPGTKALTHCNAGGLATGGYGSAVGALRAAWEEGLLAHVWVDETRPLLQGARLTAWELEALGVPHAVIADSAAAHLMSRGEVDCIVTGADRIAANGDSANKIGTYGLAVAAAHHRIPLYVVAPTSTIDHATATGAGIPIEERDGAEISTRFEAHNPAFDVTPAELIAAIVTEVGVHRAAVRGVAAAMSVLDELVRRSGRRPRFDRADPARLAGRTAWMGRTRTSTSSASSQTRAYAARRDREELRERRPGPPKADISLRLARGAAPPRRRDGRLHADVRERRGRRRHGRPGRCTRRGDRRRTRAHAHGMSSTSSTTTI